MAGHSHWAGIKHKKGRQDKLRSKIFSKISREITVAANLDQKIQIQTTDCEQQSKQPKMQTCLKKILLEP